MHYYVQYEDVRMTYEHYYYQKQSPLTGQIGAKGGKLEHDKSIIYLPRQYPTLKLQRCINTGLAVIGEGVLYRVYTERRLSWIIKIIEMALNDKH